MLKILLATLALLSLISPVSAQQVRGEKDFFKIAPRDWTLSSSGKDDERRFVSPDGDAWLSLYSTDVEGSATLIPNHWRVQPGERVTYEKRGSDWAVVSGYTHDDRIFYRRTMLACRGRKWHDLDFEYPARKKRAMDEFVTRASHALAAYRSMGCAG